MSTNDERSFGGQTLVVPLRACSSEPLIPEGRGSSTVSSSKAASAGSKLVAPLAAARVKAAPAENRDSLRRILESDRRSSH